MASAPLIDLAPGAIFAADFRIIRPLSQGGMGAVYVAEQLSTKKQRALKLMLPQLVADPKLRQRFEQEAQVGAFIESEHVVEVVGAGVDAATGAPWLAMELLRGEDLLTLITRIGPLPPAQVLQIMRELCHAVGAAHAAGIVHRDLKPENVFLAEKRTAEGKPVVKVLDFGIAKIAAEAKTQATAAIGSPLWMSPEQTRKGAVIAAPTDVWALGLITFFLLTGRSYWLAAEGEGTTLEMLLREILFDPIAPASARAGEFGRAGLIPAGFDPWFLRAVNREPAARWANAAAALAALAGVLAGSLAASSRPEAPAFTPQLAQTHPLKAPAQPTPQAAAPYAPTQLQSSAPMPSSGGATPAAGTQYQPPPIPRVSTTAAVGVGPRRAGRSRMRLWIGSGLVGLAAAGGVLALVMGGDPSPTRAEWSRRGPLPAEPRPSQLSRPYKSASAMPAALEACPVGYVRIPAGTFQMGSPEGEGEENEHPQHPVTVKSFCMENTEVTVDAYEACVSAGTCTAVRGRDQSCNTGKQGRGNHPVNCVDWDQSDAYCKWSGGRLPTEEEWEYAARGTDGRKYPWGDGAPAQQLCWTRYDSTCAVASFASGASPFGVMDMAGNVAEWTASVYCDYSGTNCADTSRVSRGGSWGNKDGSWVRAALRDRNGITFRNDRLGFRCAV